MRDFDEHATDELLPAPATPKEVAAIRDVVFYATPDFDEWDLHCRLDGDRVDGMPGLEYLARQRDALVGAVPVLEAAEAGRLLASRWLEAQFRYYLAEHNEAVAADGAGYGFLRHPQIVRRLLERLSDAEHPSAPVAPDRGEADV